MAWRPCDYPRTRWRWPPSRRALHCHRNLRPLVVQRPGQHRLRRERRPTPTSKVCRSPPSPKGRLYQMPSWTRPTARLRPQLRSDRSHRRPNSPCSRSTARKAERWRPRWPFRRRGWRCRARRRQPCPGWARPRAVSPPRRLRRRPRRRTRTRGPQARPRRCPRRRGSLPGPRVPPQCPVDPTHPPCRRGPERPDLQRRRERCLRLA